VRLPNDHAIAAAELLGELWREVSEASEIDSSDEALASKIDLIFAGKEVGYKKAIIIQLVGKAADFSLDAQALQKGTGDDGAWDAREFGKRVFVPWNATIGNPLGDADDPYVSNQFRNPRFDASIRGKRKNLELFDTTLGILERANAVNSADEVIDILRQVLVGLRRLLQGKSFDYPIPQRASLEATQSAVSKFLSVSSGGGRLQAVAHALFKGLSEAGFDYENLVARHVNASDAAGRLPGDVSFTKAGRSTAVEVKDRLLTAAQVSVSVTKARVAEVTELVFLVHGNKGGSLFTSDDERIAAEDVAFKEFSSGLNVYWESYLRLSRSLLIVLGEQGRRDFLKFVRLALEEQSVDAQHRWAWAQIVAEI
jgi:SacI restriction endonuclease